jgi:hypothetical protein
MILRLNNQWTQLVAVVATAWFSTAAHAAPPGGAKEREYAFLDTKLTDMSKIVPDPVVQQGLIKLADPQTPKAEMEAEVDRLDKLYREAGYQVIRQLLYFGATHLPGKPNTSAYDIYVPGVVMWRLRIDHDANALLRAVAPFADAPDTDSRSVLDQLVLPVVEATDRGTGNETSAYKQFLVDCQNSGAPRPDAVIRKMFERQPSKSIMACEQVYLRQPRAREEIALAAHMIDSYVWQKNFDKTYGGTSKTDPAVAATLTKLAADPQWWARLYAAQLILQNPELRNGDLVKKLKADAEDMIRKVMDQVKG